MLPLFGSVAVVFLMIGLGRLVDRGVAAESTGELAAPVYHFVSGWAIISLAGVLCALAGINLRWPMFALAALGLIGLFTLSNLRAVLPLTFAWLLLLALLVVATAIPPTMLDEFAQWLPNARFLVERDYFPNAVSANIWSARPAYPPAFPLVGYVAALLTGGSFEIVPKTFVILLGGGFGLLLAQRLAPVWGTLGAIGIGAVFAIIVNPFFDPRVALTAYTDAPTGFVLALCIYAAWRAADRPSWHWLLCTGASAALLVLLRDTNAVFVAGLACGLFLLGRRAYAPLAVSIMASASAFLLWRIYTGLALMPSANSARPFAEWDWHAPATVLRAFLFERLAGNLLVGMTACVLAAVIATLGILAALRSAAPVRRLMGLSCSVAVGWIVFLIGAYIAVFTPEETARAASLWRYLAELGPTVILLLFHFPWPVRFEKIAQRIPRFAALRATGVMMVCLVPTAVVLLTRPYWQIDCRYPEVATLHALARLLQPMNLGNTRLTVVHPREASGYALAIDYDLHRPIGSSLPVSEARMAPQDGFLLDLSQPAAPAFSLKRWDSGSWNDVAVAALAPQRDYCHSWREILAVR